MWLGRKSPSDNNNQQFDDLRRKEKSTLARSVTHRYLHLVGEDLPAVGDRIADKYIVEREMASGGMGVVLSARHEMLGQQVAIKVLRPELTSEDDVLQRFLREAQASVSLRSEHVVRVFDVGTLPSGAPYMVMEFLVGNDLADEVERHGPLSVTAAANYVTEACHALAEAHSQGVIHRDIKPANLFLTQEPDGRRLIKVVDFGISKITEDSRLGKDQSITQTMTMLGSPQYMSPEQVRSSRDVDAQTDIWALGCVLYELLSGVAPFAGESVSAVAASIVADPVPPISRFRPGLPEEVEGIILRCLEKDRDARFSSVAELARSLATFAGEGHRSKAERISLIDYIPRDGSASAITARQFPGEDSSVDASSHADSPQTITENGPGSPTRSVNATSQADTMVATESTRPGAKKEKTLLFPLLAALVAGSGLVIFLNGTTEPQAAVSPATTQLGAASPTAATTTTAATTATAARSAPHQERGGEPHPEVSAEKAAVKETKRENFKEEASRPKTRKPRPVPSAAPQASPHPTPRPDSPAASSAPAAPSSPSPSSSPAPLNDVLSDRE